MTASVLKTMCPMNCHPTLCGMRAEVEDGRLVSLTGDPDNPDSLGNLCMKGEAAHQIVDNPARILAPLVRDRRDADYRDSAWDETLDHIAAKMRAAGPERVGVWQGHGNAANDYGVGAKRGLVERFANLWGAEVWNPAMICWGLGGFGLGLTGVLETSSNDDLAAHSDMILLWGANTVSQKNITPRLMTAKKRGARIVCIDVRRTEASALAHETHLIRPGEDAALALAMMHVIVAEGLHDAEFVAEHTLGFEDLAAHIADCTPEWAAARTRIAAEAIADLARAYAATKRAAIVLGGSSLHKGPNDWRAARAIGCLPALTGALGVPGGGFGPRHGARGHGAGFADISAPDRRPRPRRVPNQMEAIIAVMEAGEIDVLFTIGSNILSSFPDTDRMRAALARVGTIVAFDIFPNQTIREAADIVLPSTIWLEEVGAKATNTHVYLADRALPAAGEARSLAAMLRGLAARLNMPDFFPWPDEESLLDAVFDHPSTGGATVAAMRANGGRAALNVSPHAYPTRAFQTPSGRVEFRSDRAAAMGLPALPDAGETGEGTLLRLAHGRSWAHFHSFYDNGRVVPALAAKETAPELWLAPDDAAARGVDDGAPIRIRAAGGSFEAVAKVTPRMPPGAVWMRDGWPGGNALTASAAVLPDTALDAFPFSVGQSDYGALLEVAPL